VLLPLPYVKRHSSQYKYILGLKLAHVGLYHAKLMERQRRKGVVQEHNLIAKYFRKDSKSLLQTKFEK